MRVRGRRHQSVPLRPKCPTNFTDPAGLAGRNVSGVQRRGDERVSYWYYEGDFIDTAKRRKGKVEVKAGFFNWDISSWIRSLDCTIMRHPARATGGYRDLSEIPDPPFAVFDRINLMLPPWRPLLLGVVAVEKIVGCDRPYESFLEVRSLTQEGKHSVRRGRVFVIKTELGDGLITLLDPVPEETLKFLQQSGLENDQERAIEEALDRTNRHCLTPQLL